MPARRRSREHALQMLYQWEAGGESPEQVIESYYRSLSPKPGRDDPFAESLVHGVAAASAEIDELIRSHSEHWRLERMSAVDRGILRMAVYEMRQGETAPAVIIDEALELGRRFSGDQSARFLNGVLDAIRKTLAAEATAGKAASSD